MPAKRQLYGVDLSALSVATFLELDAQAIRVDERLRAVDTLRRLVGEALDQGVDGVRWRREACEAIGRRYLWLVGA